MAGHLQFRTGAGRMRPAILAVGLAAWLNGCANGEPSPGIVFDSAAVRDTVSRLEAAMNESVDALDCTTGLSSLGDREPAFVSSGVVVRTASELREMCDDMVSRRRGATFDIESLTAHALSPDAAYVVREGNYTIDLLDHGPVTVYMVMTTIWHHEPGGWRMAHLHESFVPPEASRQQAAPSQN